MEIGTYLNNKQKYKNLIYVGRGTKQDQSTFNK